MSDGRALFSERQREILAGEAGVKDNYRYKVESIARQRVRELEKDLDALRENYPELYAEIEAMVEDDNDN